MRARCSLVLAATLLLAASCAEGEPSGTLEGECESGDRHCPTDSALQYCSDGEWSEPEACLPEASGTEFEVEIPTYCVDGYCRPGSG